MCASWLDSAALLAVMRRRSSLVDGRPWPAFSRREYLRAEWRGSFAPQWFEPRAPV